MRRAQTTGRREPRQNAHGTCPRLRSQVRTLREARLQLSPEERAGLPAGEKDSGKWTRKSEEQTEGRCGWNQRTGKQGSPRPEHWQGPGVPGCPCNPGSPGLGLSSPASPIISQVQMFIQRSSTNSAPQLSRASTPGLPLPSGSSRAPRGSPQGCPELLPQHQILPESLPSLPRAPLSPVQGLRHLFPGRSPTLVTYTRLLIQHPGSCPKFPKR